MLVVRPVYLAKSGETAAAPLIRSDQFGTLRNTKSVQEVSKQLSAAALYAHHGKTDLRYWQGAVFRPTYTRNGMARQASQWAIKIQHLGRRETFSLGTANKAAAAVKAKNIYLVLHSSGWEATLAKFKPNATSQFRTATTVGEFLEQVITSAGVRPKTIKGYCRAFRKIIADIFEIDGGLSKFDYRTGGRDKWIARIHAIKLTNITPDKIQNWKVAFLSRAGADPVKRRAAQTSFNSLMRQAKSLFAPKLLKFVRVSLSGTPFDGVGFEPRQSMRYRARFDLERLIQVAQQELPREQFKIFLLALMAGLRRNEIDKLEWESFDWTKHVIRIEATHYLQPKTEDSVGDVEVDPELVEIFRRFKACAEGSFVIESQILPRINAGYSHYRCERDFEALIKWLRIHGVTGKKPLHALRKEYGSQICAKHGIYAASQALRHADITITSAHYLDKRKRSTVGLGSLLKPSEVVFTSTDELTERDEANRIDR